MIRVILNGASGHMGLIVKGLIEASSDMEIVANVSADPVDWCLKDINDFTGDADCIIDFSHHAATKALTEYAVAHKIPTLIATTGQTDNERAMIKKAAEQIPVFFSANMSPAIAMICEMAAKTAKMFPDADIEVIERHHNRKIDVPSGTALMIARALEHAVEGSSVMIGRNTNGRRVPREITVHSLRIGNEVGTHEIVIATGSQTITIKHEAENRALFAEGALVAARWLVNKEAGMYNMQDMLAE